MQYICAVFHMVMYDESGRVKGYHEFINTIFSPNDENCVLGAVGDSTLDHDYLKVDVARAVIARHEKTIWTVKTSTVTRTTSS